MKTIGNKLKEARRGSNLTLMRVEEMTGISNAYLSQLENDKIKNPSGNILFKLSKLYNIPLSSIINNEIDTEKRSNNSSTFLRKVAFSAEELNENEKELVLKYLDFIKSNRNQI